MESKNQFIGQLLIETPGQLQLYKSYLAQFGAEHDFTISISVSKGRVEDRVKLPAILTRNNRYEGYDAVTGFLTDHYEPHKSIRYDE